MTHQYFNTFCHWLNRIKNFLFFKKDTIYAKSCELVLSECYCGFCSAASFLLFLFCGPSALILYKQCPVVSLERQSCLSCHTSDEITLSLSATSKVPQVKLVSTPRPDSPFFYYAVHKRKHLAWLQIIFKPIHSTVSPCNAECGQSGLLWQNTN